jgi:tungstate transport system substrate-binding protein
MDSNSKMLKTITKIISTKIISIMRNKAFSLGLLLLLLSSMVLPGCAPAPPSPQSSPVLPTTTTVSPTVGDLILATTTSTADSGLLEAILPDFETRYGAKVEVVAVGTGQALELGRSGDADVILVHARAEEDKFVEEGYGVNRQDVMYNDFVLVGPAADPAQIAGITNVITALKQIAASESIFISRGDDSGTHTKEQSLWKVTSLPLEEVTNVTTADKTYTRPTGEWYESVGQGMGATITMADEKQAYTLSDRATYLARKKEGLELEILVEGDDRLFNPYGVIAVNPEKYPDVNYDGATLFIEWITSVETQELISQFGVAELGMPLFTPDSAAWNEAARSK